METSTQFTPEHRDSSRFIIKGTAGDLTIRRTKIVCTIGPASNSRSRIKQLISAGMDVARLNFSHGTHKDHTDNINNIREISADMDRHTAILQDLSGPKIRVGEFPDGDVTLLRNNEFILTGKDVPGNKHIASLSYKNLPKEVNPGDILLLSDGLIQLKVIASDNVEIRCKVEVGGQLSSYKGINLPTGTLKVPSMTEKDKKDLKIGIKEKVDYIALSFVRKVEDIDQIKQSIKDSGSEIPVIAKIEKHEAVNNIDEIIAAADGIMVARGDLGVEIPAENVPAVQKMLVRKCNKASKPVITATQMLRSMVDHPIPSRAEVTDVANAILDGTDAIMLSEETAIGHFPIKAVKIMSKIAARTESSEDFKRAMSHRDLPDGNSITEAIGHSAVQVAQQVNATAILTPTAHGKTSWAIARYRPPVRIIALSSNLVALRRLSLIWGVTPLYMNYSNDVNTMMRTVVEKAIEHGFKQEDKLVITASVPAGGMTNMIKVEVIGCNQVNDP